ncbi:hypothetical protein Tco_1473044 [Tanacetum coccineum]
MSSITAQQAKLDLELVSKEKRLKIGKCNGRLNPGKIQREPIFQDSVYKHDTFYRFKMDKRKRFKLTLEIFKDIFKICPRVQGQDFDALPTDEEIVSLSGKTAGLDKIRLSYAQILSVSPEEPTRKLKRVTRPTKKSTKAPARGVVIRETLKMPLSKKKEKVDVARGKGIELLSDVELTKKAQFEEIQRKSMRDFHKTHPSGSGTVTKTAPSAAKIKPSGNDEDDINNEQDSSGEDSDQENDSDDDKTQSDNENESVSEHETNENELGSESDQDENKEDIGDDEEEVKDELVKTPSNDSDDEDETKITHKAEGNEDEKIDYTTNQLYDDVDIRLNEPVDTDKGFIQKEGTNSKITNVQ